MNFRIHLYLLVVFFIAYIGCSSSEVSVSKDDNKLSDDLYIDDEGNDDIQLQDEASGSNPLVSAKVDEEIEEEEEEDKEDTSVNKETKQVEKHVDAEEVAPPKAIPVASRSYPSHDIDSDGSGSGIGPNEDEEEEEEEEEEDDDVYHPSFTEKGNEDDVIGGIDITSVISNPTERNSGEVETRTTPGPVPEVRATESLIPKVRVNDVPVGTGVTPVPSGPPPAPVDNDISNDVHKLNNKPEDRPTSFFAQPGILAAVIGGAVVGLLCAILLVMFIVYRMRKKDEGSYVLEEPKRNSSNSNPYNKNSREFYA
nr:EOG090X0QLW [Cyclestheria hislopi]